MLDYTVGRYKVEQVDTGWVVVDMEKREVVSEDFSFRFSAIHYAECLKVLDGMQLSLNLETN